MRKENIVQALSAPLAPPTQERPYRLDTDQKIPRPYVARASVAPSVEKPNGTASFVEKYRNYVSRYCPWDLSHKLTIHPPLQSVMQQHCIYWDRDEDGVIWPYDTWVGFRDLGFNVIFSFLAVIVIHASLSLPSR
jgi:peroxygenase